MLHEIVDNAHEAAYIDMMNRTETQDEKDKWIKKRANELIKNFGNDNDWQIVELINKKLDNNYVSEDLYNQFITDICYYQATYEYDKSNKTD